jgi:glycosyltransferase involved in cell wall biosynthesis
MAAIRADTTMPIRLLHLHSGNLFGGVETSLLACARLRKMYPNLEHTFGLCFEGRLQNELTAAGEAPHMLFRARFRWPWTVWIARRRLRHFLKSQSFDVVVCHCSWAHSLFAPTVRSFGLPLVFWVRDLITGRSWLERLAQRTPPDLVLTNSRFTLEATTHVFPGVPRRVQYPIMAPFTVPEDAQTFARVTRAELGTPTDAVVIVHVARLEPWKGHRLLLHALARLRTSTPWVCWFVGGPQRRSEEGYLADLKSRAARLGITDRVLFLGQRGDVPRLLAAADVHCQPNTRPEPFGIAFVEAMSVGLPIVTTAIGGAREILDDTCALLVPPDNPDALANALNVLLEDGALRHRLGDNGKSQARESFAPERALARLHESLETILEKRPSLVAVPS